MNSLSTSSVQTFLTTQVSDFGEVAAAVITATILLGLGIYLVFWGLNKIKGGMG